MCRKRGVISTAVVHMQNQRHIQYLCLKLCILPVLAQHHQDVLRHGQFRLWRVDIQILAPFIIIRVVPVYHQHRELRNQVQTLAQHIGNARIVCFVIIGIKLKDAPGDAVHHIPAGRLHDDVPHEIRRQRTAFRKHLLKMFQLVFCREFTEQKQIGGFLKSGMFRLKEASYQVFDIVAAVVKVALARNGFPVHNLRCADIGNIRQSGEHAFPVQVAESPFHLEFCVQFLVNPVVLFAFESQFFNFRSNVEKNAVNVSCHIVSSFSLFSFSPYVLSIILKNRNLYN